MKTEQYKIIQLPKEQWQNTIIPLRYTTDQYYDVQIDNSADGFEIKLVKKQFDEPVSHYPEEYDFPDKLYQPFWEKAYAWGIVESTGSGDELVACIESCPEEWSNRLMVTELWVHERIRRNGIGHALMDIVKQQARLEHRRAIILETQSCNVPAISFYLHEGFELNGIDACCYSNDDIGKKEVRVNLVYYLRTKKIRREDVTIRPEKPGERHAVEQAVLNSFWNKYRQGCDEHLLVHQIRDSDVYVPELSRIAVVDGEIAGVICYTRTMLENGGKTKDILTFGPLCVVPEYQCCGVGGMLLDETAAMAKEMGWDGIVIFGEPDYYPRHGFKTCDNFGITTADGKNFDAFMGMELKEGGLSGFGGRYIEPDIFELSEEENIRYTEQFDTPEKQKFPGQW